MLGPILITTGIILLGAALLQKNVALEGPRLIFSFLPWSEQYTRNCISTFLEEWLKVHPADRNQLIRMLNELTITWTQTRIIVNEIDIAFGIIDSSTDMRIWIGPRIRDKQRSILNTALLSQLVILSAAVTGRKPESVELKEILRGTASVIRYTENQKRE